MAEWWASDALAIIIFTPFLLVYVAPLVGSWLKSGRVFPTSAAWRRSHLRSWDTGISRTIWIGYLRHLAGFRLPASGFLPASPYLLFVPVIWVAVRRGLPGAIWTTFAIILGMTFAAWVSHGVHSGLPRFQLAMLALGLTGLCLGAVVTERKKSEQELRLSEAGTETGSVGPRAWAVGRWI